MGNFRRPTLAEIDLAAVVHSYSRSKAASFVDVSGEANLTLIVDLENADQLVLRVCNNGYTSVAHLLAEIGVLDYLEARGFQYSPRLVRTPLGVAVTNSGPYRVIAMHRLSGRHVRSADLAPEALTSLAVGVGRMSALLADCEVVTLPPEESFVARTDTLMVDFGERIRALGWPIDGGAVQELWRQLSAELRDRTRTQGQLLHSDLWPPNILFDVAGSLSGILDFDDLTFGPAVLDLAACLAEFAVPEGEVDLDPVRSVRLVAGYQRSRSLRTDELEFLAEAILACNLSWYAQMVFHGLSHDETEIYYRRILALTAAEARQKLMRQLSLP